ncbi:MAG TPA: Rid family detoxifying hydrolase, partial [Bacteroidales bacterium]|nr:Rid family detoxifying hydrolase [Bacteroidales bacterium]
MKTIINSKLAPCAIGPYNQAVRANDFLFISGQIPVIPETGEAITDDIEAATERVMENIKAILNGAGLDFKDVVKSTIFITNMNDFAKINDIYSK